MRYYVVYITFSMNAFTIYTETDLGKSLMNYLLYFKSNMQKVDFKFYSKLIRFWFGNGNILNLNFTNEYWHWYLRVIDVYVIN